MQQRDDNTPRMSGLSDLWLRGALDLRRALLVGVMAYQKRPDLGHNYAAAARCAGAAPTLVGPRSRPRRAHPAPAAARGRWATGRARRAGCQPVQAGRRCRARRRPRAGGRTRGRARIRWCLPRHAWVEQRDGLPHDQGPDRGRLAHRGRPGSAHPGDAARRVPGGELPVPARGGPALQGRGRVQLDALLGRRQPVEVRVGERVVADQVARHVDLGDEVEIPEELL